MANRFEDDDPLSGYKVYDAWGNEIDPDVAFPEPTAAEKEALNQRSRAKYRPADPSGQLFYDAYERLSWEGKCDCAGGMEYERVLAEWRFRGCPPAIDEFIVARAN